MEKIATGDTKLIYMTAGVLLQKLVSAKSLMEFTHVFIDEVSICYAWLCSYVCVLISQENTVQVTVTVLYL